MCIAVRLLFVVGVCISHRLVSNWLMFEVAAAATCYSPSISSNTFQLLDRAIVETQRGCEVLCDVNSLVINLLTKPIFHNITTFTPIGVFLMVVRFLHKGQSRKCHFSALDSPSKTRASTRVACCSSPIRIRTKSTPRKLQCL